MRAIESEIASQPRCWRLAAALAGSARAELPDAGSRVAAVGCGSSLYVARAYASARERAGQGETDAFPASEFPAGRGYGWTVAISRSGTTTEVVDLLRRRPAARTVLITAGSDGPAARAADRVVRLDFADERSVVQTRFATSALALLRAQLGDNLSAASRDGERALRIPLPPLGFEHFVFLGRGPSVGVAEEAALKLREACGAWSEAYPALEYRHGPISVAAAGTLVWMLPPVEASLAEEVRATGATVLEADLDPLAELVRIHRYAVQLADARGLDPERPRHLSRSVVLDGG